MILEKDGIVFCIVESSFRRGLDVREGLKSAFKRMESLVKSYLAKTHGKPVVIVFPEAVLGSKPVYRQQTKQWIASIAPYLERHGKAYVFLSVLEHAPKGKLVTNTGYLIEPPNNNGGRVHWQAYAKKQLTFLDHEIIKGIGKFGDKIKKAEERWKKTRNRFEPSFRFPRVKINSKDVELRVCGDVREPVRSKTDVLIVPANGLLSRVQSLPEQQVITSAIKKNGIAIVNDSLTKPFFVRHGTDNPIVTPIKRGRIRLK